MRRFPARFDDVRDRGVFVLGKGVGQLPGKLAQPRRDRLLLDLRHQAGQSLVHAVTTKTHQIVTRHHTLQLLHRSLT